MKFTVDRLNRLLMIFGHGPLAPDALLTTGYNDPTVPYTRARPAHNVLDILDKRAGVKTSLYLTRSTEGYVGARLARLERHLLGRSAAFLASLPSVPDYTFWLGVDGENPDRCLMCDGPGQQRCECY